MSEYVQNNLSQRICVAVLSFIQKRHGNWQEALRELGREIEAFLHNNAEAIGEEKSAQAFMLRLEGNVAEFPSEHFPVSRKNGKRVAEAGLKNRGLTIQEAAAHCGYSVSGFRKWMQRSSFNCRIPGTHRYDLSALNAILDKCIGNAHSVSELEQWAAGNDKN